MDARLGRIFVASLLAIAISLVVREASAVTPRSSGPHVRTANFVVLGAQSPEFARQVADAAEAYRKDLAVHWLGRELGRWESPCVLTVVAGEIPAQGVTKYVPLAGSVRDFQMEVVGTPERILDSVLPHEITHAVLATYFRRPLPRWADEGISTTVEHVAEKAKHDYKLREFLTTGRGIPMNRMFLMKEYPAEMLTLYAQGYSVCRFLIEQRGPQEFIRFIESYFAGGSWTAAVRKHYHYESLAELQELWLAWVQAGSGAVDLYVKGAQPQENSSSAVVALASGSPQGVSGKSSGVALASASSDPPSVASAASADGWYRQRRDAIARGSQPSPSTLGATLEGTLSPTQAPKAQPQAYSTAQPQAEQGSVPRILYGPASTWSPNKY